MSADLVERKMNKSEKEIVHYSKFIKILMNLGHVDSKTRKNEPEDAIAKGYIKLYDDLLGDPMFEGQSESMLLFKDEGTLDFELKIRDLLTSRLDFETERFLQKMLGEIPEKKKNFKVIDEEALEKISRTRKKFESKVRLEVNTSQLGLRAESKSFSASAFPRHKTISFYADRETADRASESEDSTTEFNIIGMLQSLLEKRGGERR